eukprot:scaffold8396_cov84-Phaeocystis_antarctica.AAC.1
MEAVVRSTVMASGSRPSPETPFGTRGLTSSRAFVTQHPLAAGSRAARCSSAPPTSDQRRVGGLCDHPAPTLLDERLVVESGSKHSGRRAHRLGAGHSSVVQMSTSPRVIQPPAGVSGAGREPDATTVLIARPHRTAPHRTGGPEVAAVAHEANSGQSRGGASAHRE